jgi:hypothetical protein
LLSHQPGAGKTLGALLVSETFVRIGLPVVFLSYKQQQLRNEITKFKAQLPTLQQQATKKGLFQVHGLREWANKVYDQTTRQFDVGELKFIKGGLLVVDECHNLYNQEELNRTGTVIAMLGSVLSQRIRILLTSATPVSNHHEIPELTRLMMTPDDSFDPRQTYDYLKTDDAARSQSYQQRVNVLLSNSEHLVDYMLHAPAMSSEMVRMLWKRWCPAHVSITQSQLTSLPSTHFVGDHTIGSEIGFVPLSASPNLATDTRDVHRS